MTENPAKDNDRKALRMQKKTPSYGEREPSPERIEYIHTPVEGAIASIPGIQVASQQIRVDEPESRCRRMRLPEEKRRH